MASLIAGILTVSLTDCSSSQQRKQLSYTYWHFVRGTTGVTDRFPFDWPGNKPLSEPMMIIYLRIYESLGRNELNILRLKQMAAIVQTKFSGFDYSFKLVDFKLISTVCDHPVGDSSFDFSALNTWWRHQMETFSMLLALCAGNSPVTGEFPSKRPVMRSFDVFFDLRLNKPLSKQSLGWWFEMPSCPLWCHSNNEWSCVIYIIIISCNWCFRRLKLVTIEKT